MGFQQIDHVYLEYNKEYKIGNKFRGIYKGKRWIGYRDPYPGWGFHLEFDDVRDLEKRPVKQTIFPTDYAFYEFFSEKEAIQACMEYRAVNRIIQSITGDDTFSWLP